MTIKTRLANVEAQVAPEIPADVRDPKLVELTQQILGDDYPIEHIPCGISGQKFLNAVLKEVHGRCRALPITGDDELEERIGGGQYGNH